MLFVSWELTNITGQTLIDSQTIAIVYSRFKAQRTVKIFFSCYSTIESLVRVYLVSFANQNVGKTNYN